MSTTNTEDSMRRGSGGYVDLPTLFDSGPADPKRKLCGACGRGEHADHHTGVWARADGSDPVVCDCETCETPNAVNSLIALYRVTPVFQHDPVGSRGGSDPPLDAEKAHTLFTTHRTESYRRVRKLILALALEFGYFHGEQLAEVAIPQRNMIGTAVNAMMRDGLLVEGPHRKGTNRASHGRRSYEYHLTETGRELAERVRASG